MRKVFFTALLWTFFMPAAEEAGAGEFNIGFDRNQIDSIPIPMPDKPAIYPGKTAKSKTAKDWTVMVFMNGKNNLESGALADVNEMEEAGSTNKINIVVELGRMNGQQTGDSHEDGDWTGVRRYYIQKDNDEDRITSPVLQDLGNVNMGDYRSAVDFAKWAKANFPANHYLFILWNHGGGWLTGISTDEQSQDKINTTEIGKVMREIGRVDILAFDACSMQMAEIAYEVKDYAEVIVGSEETIPGQGYPYNIFLEALAKNPGMYPETLGAAIVNAYGTFYKAKNDSLLADTGKSPDGETLSAIRTSKLPDLARRVIEFAALAKGSGDINALKIAKKYSTRYGVFSSDEPLYIKTPYVDFYDFVNTFSRRLAPKTPGADIIRQKAKEIKEFISGSLIIKNVALGEDPLGFPLINSHGISIYMPPRSPSMTRSKIEDEIANISYADTDFDRDTNWLDFVIFMYKIELGEGRDMPPQSDEVAFS